MKKITEMNREEILALKPEDITRPLTPDEVVHIATVLDAFWSYDYDAAKAGKPGLHALLKSEQHSDGYFVSRILLAPENVLKIMAWQIVKRLLDAGSPNPTCVIGIPDGATRLGKAVAELINADTVEMRKENGRLVMNSMPRLDETILLVEDFCTRGTGFTEAVLEVRRKAPRCRLIQFDPVIINRGGLSEIVVDGVGRFDILPVVERRIKDWGPDECPLCWTWGSEAIKPKVTDADWARLLASQK